MKKLLFVLSICLGSSIFAQFRMDNIAKQDLKEIKTSFEKKDLKTLVQKYPVYQMKGGYYLSLFGKVNASFNRYSLPSGVLFGSRINDVISFKIDLNLLSQLDQIVGLDYIEIPAKIKADLDRAVHDIHADSVQHGWGLPQAFTGKDVYIGICDWGFDYTHPNFYDTTLTQTRILAAWDQYRSGGTNPNGFSYGAEFDTPTELLNAQCDTANIYSYAYHGSHVAGICGGSGAGTVYRGVAFEANYLFATFLVDAASVMDAYQWMFQRASQDGKRLVINQSWGLHHIGNLDGTSLLSQAIDGYSSQGVVFSSSAGNNGNVNFHLSKTFNNDELKSKVDFYDYSANANMWGQSLSLWGEPTKSFQVSVQVLNASNTLLTETPFYNTLTSLNYVDSMLVSGTDTIWFNVSCEAANPLNMRPHVRFRVKNTNTALKVIMRVQAVDGTIHCWNVTELTTDVGNWGMPFSVSGSGTVAGNVNFGISEPACTNSTIAVAAYAAQYSVGQGTVGGGVASFSSWGPTLDNRVKPDIAAPGINIGSSFSSFTDASFSAIQTVQFNGRSYPFAKISGTSMSAPMVSGVVALILDANPYLSAQQVKDIIQMTARTDNFTGVIPDTGSVRWGYGKINAYAAVLEAIDLLGEVELKTEKIQLFPNPAQDKMTVQSNLPLPNSAKVFDMTGKFVSLPIINSTLDVSVLKSGTYVFQVLVEGKIVQEKFVKL